MFSRDLFLGSMLLETIVNRTFVDVRATENFDLSSNKISKVESNAFVNFVSNEDL